MHSKVFYSYAEAHKDGLSGVDGLAGASYVTVSPDGKSVYVAGSSDNALALFDFSLQDIYLPFVMKNN